MPDVSAIGINLAKHEYVIRVNQNTKLIFHLQKLALEVDRIGVNLVTESVEESLNPANPKTDVLHDRKDVVDNLQVNKQLVPLYELFFSLM